MFNCRRMGEELPKDSWWFFYQFQILFYQRVQSGLHSTNWFTNPSNSNTSCYIYRKTNLATINQYKSPCLLVKWCFIPIYSVVKKCFCWLNHVKTKFLVVKPSLFVNWIINVTSPCCWKTAEALEVSSVACLLGQLLARLAERDEHHSVTEVRKHFFGL